MRARTLMVGAVIGGVLLFLWGALYNTVLPFASRTLDAFANDQEVVESIRRSAPRNGIYLSDKGVFAAVDLRPDGSVRVPSLGVPMGIELLADLGIGLMLTIVLLNTGRSGLPRPAVVAAAALAAGLGISLSHWNWFGFSTGFTAAEILEVVFGWLLVGLVLARLIDRLARAPA